MQVMAYDIRSGSHLERTALNKFRQKVCGTQLNTVPRICANDQRLHFNFLFFYLTDIAFQPSMALQLFLEDKKASLRIMPAITVISDLRLHHGNLKHFYFLIRMAWTGICIQCAGHSLSFSGGRSLSFSGIRGKTGVPSGSFPVPS